jgi:hypothetical protein
MGIRYCKNNPDHPIPESTRTDAVFCSQRCGWQYRNRKKATKTEEFQKIERDLYTNYRIIKDMLRKDISEISKDTAIVLGFNLSCHTGILDIDNLNGTAEFELFDYSYIITGERIKFKKT